MITLGLRASPKTATFCVYNTELRSIVNLENIAIPNVFDTPEKLKYLRITVLDIIREFGVSRAGIRLTENHPKARPNVSRVQYEGIVLEAFASSNVHSFYQGNIQSIAKRIGRPSSAIKPLIEGKTSIEWIDNWTAFSSEEREAILAAMGAENA